MRPDSDGIMASWRCARRGIAVSDDEPVTFPVERGCRASHGLVNAKVVVTGMYISKVGDQGQDAQRYDSLELRT
jgi:hypothetical protein